MEFYQESSFLSPVSSEGGASRGSRRKGVPAETELLGELARAVTLEDLGLDPLDFAPESFWASLNHRIREGYEYLSLKDGQPIFRAAVSGATPDAVLVEGVFVPPEARGNGYGKAGMHALCVQLLKEHETIILLVDESNDAARRLYDRLGFEIFDDYQAVFFDVSFPSFSAPEERRENP